jgi:hypothetical protein
MAAKESLPAVILSYSIVILSKAKNPWRLTHRHSSKNISDSVYLFKSLTITNDLSLIYFYYDSLMDKKSQPPKELA